MPKMTEKEMRDAVRIATQYDYTPGQVSAKEPLTKKIKMAIMGKSYKTDAAEKALRKRKEIERRDVEKGANPRTRSDIQTMRNAGMTEDEIRKLRGK